MIRSLSVCLSTALAAALLFGCGASKSPTPEDPPTPAAADEDAPPPAPTPTQPADEDAPPSLDDEGAKPGEHGCGSCAVRVCAAGAGISGLRVSIDLKTTLEGVRYHKAVLRLKTADGRGEAALLDAAKLAPGVPSVQSVGASQLSQVKTASDMKGGTALLELHWSGADGSGASQLPIAVAVGSCP